MDENQPTDCDDEGPISLPINAEEREMVELLREEMDLADDEAVLRLLVRQAVQRVAITCPTCGHYARLTAEDEAQCRSCLSVIKLSEGIWYLDH
jgi:hypothetical protein